MSRTENLVGLAQKEGVKIKAKIRALDQFIDTRMVEAGSNTENRFVIIFS